ncbi:MAG: ABC transporter ATP-binding protein, partial [Nitrospinae bacterium]|nr:ABC transporter ATP-binding protein [Nitrospinota bacterium]
MNEIPDNSAAIEAHGVSYTYQEGTLALDNVSLTFRRGEFVALLASNGSGKSTLIKTIVGLLKPQQGHIRIDGIPLETLDDRTLYSKARVVFQNPDGQLFAPTVGEDVAFGPRNLGLAEEEVERRVTEALAAVDAAHLRRKAIHHLSFGEKKRVSLAGVLAMRPSILILDEPTGGLDPMGEVGMMRLLSALNCER